MKVGLVLPLFSGDAARVLSFAQRAEELGYDGVFAFDHFFPPGAGPDRPSLEAFATLSAVASVTSRVAVGTLVARAQLRPAGLLAKTAANVDQLSGGRMILGLGTGDPIDEPEHRAFGIKSLGKAERRAHLAETVQATKALFRGEPWGGGAHVPAIRGPVLPPTATGGPPVWIGGLSDEVVHLAGRFADGWNGWGLEPARFARKAAILREEGASREAAAEPTWAGIALVGRDQEEATELLHARRTRGMPDTGIFVGGAEAFAEHLRGIENAGAGWAILVPAGPRDRVELIAETVLAAGGREGAAAVPPTGADRKS
jgi:alkanesulfonate monooxygenase SsuD/methylene tetrahydromethanopterin reductase-like flavin-dependent oxidoreductase (luciferase family)